MSDKFICVHSGHKDCDKDCEGGKPHEWQIQCNRMGNSCHYTKEEVWCEKYKEPEVVVICNSWEGCSSSTCYHRTRHIDKHLCKMPCDMPHADGKIECIPLVDAIRQRNMPDAFVVRNLII